MSYSTASSLPSISSNGAKGGEMIEIDTLIVGAGPAGASLACFLASYGIHGMMVSSASGNTDTPRAHITNMATLECLRDIGLEEQCARLGNQGDCMLHTRWCHSMTGEEYARIHSWGNDPKRQGDYIAASPCRLVDFPQTLLEPMLVRYATLHGFKCRFDTTFVAFVEEIETATVLSTLKDMITGHEYVIRSKYLFGADGARSTVMRQLQLPLLKQPGGGAATNVLVEADLSHLLKHRRGNLHWLIQPDVDNPDYAWIAVARMVKPWHEWMFIFFPKPDADVSNVPEDAWLKRVRGFIGDESIPVRILDISTWKVNEIVAKQYSKGNVFCLGDAVHKHPPFNGLGSNTCVQDAYNLAWKIAYVLQGRASPSLLVTYDVERQPVGYSVIKRANDCFREHFAVWQALGMLPDDINERKKALNELSASTIEGRERRKALQQAIAYTAHEFHALGTEMGQRYVGTGIYTKDEKSPYNENSAASEDPVFFYTRGTYPGSRLPHAWLNKAIPEEQISTIDLAGKGAFTLLTGIGGELWKTAATEVSHRLKISIKAYSIGFRQDWEDVYFDWEEVRGVDESGAVLARPDRFVAWRCHTVLESGSDCTFKLLEVMRSVLGYKSCKQRDED